MMKLKRTPIALALAGGLLLSGASAATPEVITLYTAEPVVIVEEIALVEFDSTADSMLVTEYTIEPADSLAGFEWVLGPELVTYYLPAPAQIAMANPTAPSESDSWGG